MTGSNDQLIEGLGLTVPSLEYQWLLEGGWEGEAMIDPVIVEAGLFV